MSTNINIDVTLQKLQEVANETTEKNREEKKARDEDLALEAKAAELSGERDGSVPPIKDLVDSLGQPISRTGEPPSEKQKPNEADKSSVPDTYKKLDPGAGAVSLFKPMFCGYRQTQVFDNPSEQTINHEFFLANGQKQVIEVTRPNTGSGFYIDPLEDESYGPSIASNRTSASFVFNEAYVVLPLGNGNFLFCYFRKDSAQYKQLIEYGTAICTIAETDPVTNEIIDLPVEIECPRDLRAFDNASTPSQTNYVVPVEYQYDLRSRNAEDQYFLAVLVSANAVKEVPFPARFRNLLLRLYPLPATIGNTITVGDPPQQFDWTFFQAEPRIGYENEVALFGHYLDSSLSVQSFTGGPAIYWWLSNPANRDLSSLTGAQIRSQYPGANYGVSRGGRWYTPYSLADQQNDFNSSGIFGASLTRPGSFKPNFTSLQDQRDFSEQEKAQRVAGPYRNGQLQIDEGDRVQLVLAWDGNVGGYCNASALQLGFRPSDLTFGESVDE